MASRWFIVPPAERSLPEGAPHDTETYPKHTDREGVTGTLYTTLFFDKQTYKDLPWAGQEMLIVLLIGTEQVITDIEAEPDAYTMEEHNLDRATVADYLSDIHDGPDRTFDEWMGSFNIR